MTLKHIPIVFISSTVEDLQPYRATARDAALRAGFYPLMQEYFVARDHPPLKECMERVAKADLVVAIVAHRYGWAPQDQPGSQAKSIAWLECENAADDGKEILAFMPDEHCDWPFQFQESYRTMAAVEQDKATPELLAEVQRNVSKLKEFKQWLEKTRIRRTFSSVESLGAEVGAALGDWLKRHPEFAESAHPRAVDDPGKYLEALREQTAWIDIRGLHVGTQKVHRFPIEELYIPLTVAGPAEIETGKGEMPAQDRQRSQSMELQEALSSPKLVIVGDPGSGKTTFLKRIAFALTDAVLRERIAAAASEPVEGGDGIQSFFSRLAKVFQPTGKNRSRLGKTPHQPFPILIRVADLSEHVRKRLDRHDYPGPSTSHAPSWIWDFMDAQNQEMNWGLSGGFFREQMEGGSAVLLIDGLDEAPNKLERQSMARLLEHATQAYQGCRFVVTTRPLSYSGESTLAGFAVAQIEPLARESVEKFLARWCTQVSPTSPSQARLHLTELLQALNSRAEIRRMANNPVMLTALAVLHWNERRLPEQRSELYRSILGWLARTREQRKGRESADRCLTLLQHLALAMQDSGSGEREIQVSQRRATEILQNQFPSKEEEQAMQTALAFVEQEEADSGIIVSRGNEIRFWHLTFQEYLAALAIAGLPDSDQHQLLLQNSKIFRPEWREAALLLGGVLMEQGKAKVDGLIGALLSHLGPHPNLLQQAQCAGLIGAMLRDLQPRAYQVLDSRYQFTLEAALGVFNSNAAQGIDLQVRLEAAEALGQAGDPRLHQEQNNWITIPAGSFLMGAQKQFPDKPNHNPEADDDEGPVHEVRLESFRIGRYPVTVEEYRRFMEADGYENRAWWKGGGFAERNQPDEWEEQLLHPNRPVVSVTWYEAAAWCAWAGGRLPSEAEWERAARGADGRKYPWGNQAPDPERANYDETGIRHATPVGLFPRGMTPDGIHDLAGNVWEWVGDWYDETYYGKSPAGNPRGPKLGRVRVLRGGSWISESRGLRASYRYRFEPGDRFDDFGFRCVREVIP